MKGFLGTLGVIGIIVTGEVFAIEGDKTLGKVLYKKECAICHGAQGMGNGSASHFLYPKPRDFTTGVYKIRSTSTLPTDEDLRRTIHNGIPGTLMPSFAHLSSKEQWALVAYVKAFCDKFEKKGSLEPIAIADPPAMSQQLIDKGDKLYNTYGCVKCHGPRGKGDGPAAATLKDSWGDPIVPYDFTIPGKMKGGSTAADIYRTLAVGIGGTPMPAYGEPKSEEHQEVYWAIAYYVLSLTGEAPPEVVSGNPVIGKELFTGTRRFENRAAPCMACHSVTGLGARGVGSFFGPDLTPAHSKFGDEGITTILSDLPFPTMNAVFSKYPLTSEERNNLISFFRAATPAQQPTGAIRERGRTPVYFAPTAGVGVLTVIFLTVIGFRYGYKKTEART